LASGQRNFSGARPTRIAMPFRLGSIPLVLLLATAAHAAQKRQLEGVVNLNTASADQLQLLPGIGPAKVRNIVAYRTKHPFRTVEELVRIKGIGRKMFRRLRLHLAVSGPTTAQQIIRADPDPLLAALPEPPRLLRRSIPFLPPVLVGPPWIRRPPPRPPPAPAPRANCLRGP
jgi:competence protein ComEA